MRNDKQILTNSKKRKSLKFILIVVCIYAFIFIGCSRYQYVLIDSDLVKNESKEFFVENDTLMMKYNFSGTDFPVTITVFNKLRQPLYFDWRKSMVIMNDVPIADAFDCVGQVDSIVAQSHATIKSNNLSDKFIPLSTEDKKARILIPAAVGYRQKKVHVFDQETSPVFFRSVLAISTQKDSSSLMYYDHPFWVSGVYQTLDDTFPNSTPNQFYMQKTTGFATFMTYTGAIILLVGLAAITPAEQ